MIKLLHYSPLPWYVVVAFMVKGGKYLKNCTAVKVVQ